MTRTSLAFTLAIASSIGALAACSGDSLEDSRASATAQAVPSDFDCEWYQKEIGFFDAWATLAARKDAAGNPLRPGEGVMIGLVDTGYLPNPEIMSPVAPGAGIYIPEFRLGSPTISLGILNFVESDRSDDPTDLYVAGASTPSNWGHGTSNLSLLLGAGSLLPGQNGNVSGVVRYAKVLPIRAATGVALINDDPSNKTANIRSAASAIISATGMGAKVVTMAMGALDDVAPTVKQPGEMWNTTFGQANEMQHAADVAEARGAILIAAAGQGQNLFVPIPARFNNVIAVGGSSSGQGAWAGSTQGAAVDVSAPAENVCVSEPASPEADGNGAFEYRHGIYSGTSFATALVSAVAALWLEYHGYDALAEAYGQKNISKLFRYVVASEGHTTPAGWDTHGYGVGIIHADRALRAELPSCVGKNADECSAYLSGLLSALGH